MNKNSLFNRLARSTFESQSFQESWQRHVDAFGPILLPAFQDDYKTRVELIEALNMVQRGNVKGGAKKLNALESRCQCDADRAAWYFCLGLCFEVSGRAENTYRCYMQAGQYGHKYYLPYLKVARSAHAAASYDIALANYRCAAGCFDEGSMPAKHRTLLASIYLNMTSCLTSMHRLEEAMEALAHCDSLYPRQKGRGGVAALLYAAMGDGEKARKSLLEAGDMAPEDNLACKREAEQILDGTHPHFCALPVDSLAIRDLWDWFCREEDKLFSLLKKEDYEEFSQVLGSRLHKVFPYLDQPPQVSPRLEKDTAQVVLADFYMESLKKGYAQLLESAPSSLSARWHFTVMH